MTRSAAGSGRARSASASGRAFVRLAGAEFHSVARPVAWASEGIVGERIWARDRAAVPGVVGIAMTGWGLVALDVWPTAFGTTLVVLAQLWRIDRLGWMYEELAPSR